jgi:hypothetical protein
MAARSAQTAGEPRAQPSYSPRRWDAGDAPVCFQPATAIADHLRSTDPHRPCNDSLAHTTNPMWGDHPRESVFSKANQRHSVMAGFLCLLPSTERVTHTHEKRKPRGGPAPHPRWDLAGCEEQTPLPHPEPLARPSRSWAETWTSLAKSSGQPPGALPVWERSPPQRHSRASGADLSPQHRA